MRIAAYFDDSPISHMAVSMAAAFAGKTDAELFVVSTIVRDTPIRHSRLQEREEEMESKVAGLVGSLGVNYGCRLSVDSADEGEQIVKFAKRKKIDWLYIGTPKKSKLAKLVMGSISLFVILNAPCPVVTISEQVRLDM